MKNLFRVLILFIVGFLFGFFSDKIFEINQSQPIHIHRVGHIPVPDSLANNGELISDFYRGPTTPILVLHPKFTMEANINFLKGFLKNLTLQILRKVDTCH